MNLYQRRPVSKFFLSSLSKEIDGQFFKIVHVLPHITVETVFLGWCIIIVYKCFLSHVSNKMFTVSSVLIIFFSE